MITNKSPEELIRYLYTTYDLSSKWPKKLEVDADTYGRVCQHIFNQFHGYESYSSIMVSIGTNRGIMFKGIELILR
jgi:hypothetical protein